MEAAAGLGYAQVKINTKYSLDCTFESDCPETSEDSDSRGMFQTELSAVVLLARPTASVKPVLRLGGMVRFIPATEATSTSASFDGTDLTGLFPAFGVLPIGGFVISPGLRIRLGRYLRLEFEQGFLYMPDTERESIDPDVSSGGYDGAKAINLAVRPQVMLRFAF